jgi:7-alpha-hydroxysteroid dehydrogenase
MAQVDSATPATLRDEPFRLDGHVALITGAGKGIGACIARVFAAAGADVALVARSADDLERVAADVRDAGRSALPVANDVADISRAAEIVERTTAEFGRLDVLVNNAGGAPPAAYLDTTPEALDEAFHFNVAAAFALTQRATPLLLESPRASIVNITSRMDRLAARGLMTYGTVKAAVTHMTHLLALEMAPTIRVNGIAPGVVATETLKQVLEPAQEQQISAATPLRRLASSADVAYTARWLASPAASYITGKVIDVDGGAEAPVFPDDTPDLKPPKR